VLSFFSELASMASSKLTARAGDVQALKACIAAAAAGSAVDLKAVAAGQQPVSLFGTPSICLSTTEGLQLTEPNAAALYLSGMTDVTYDT
jgi:hypothetical protein